MEIITKQIKDKNVKNENLFLKIYIPFVIITIIALIILYMLGNLNHKGILQDFELIMESPAGYVYKAKVVSKGFFSPNFFIYKYSNKPLKILHKPDYIKNYGYALELNRAPDWYNKDSGGSTCNNEDGSFIVSNLNIWSAYSNNIILSKGEKYKTSLYAQYNTIQYNEDYTIRFSLDRFNEYLALAPINYLENNFVVYEAITEIYDSIDSEYPITFYFPKGSFECKYIKVEQENNYLYIKNNSFVVLTLDTKNINDINIECEYTLKLNNIVFIIILISIIPLVITYFIYMYRLYKNYKTNEIVIENYKKIVIKKSDYVFILILSIICLAQFCFFFWFYFPGYFQNSDIINVMTNAVYGNYNNANPVIIQIMLHILYTLFGYKTFYLFLINLILFFVGLYSIILCCYMKFKNKLILLLLLLPFISAFHFTNIGHYKDYTGTLFLWMSYSLIFFIINIKLDKKLKYIIFFLSLISLLFGLLFRHNYIVMVYTIFVLFTYNILKKLRNTKLYIFYFANFMILFAFLLILVVKIVPIIFIKNRADISINPTGIYLIQIAACSVPNNDDSLIPKGWYEAGKSFDDVKIVYNQDNLNADNFATHWKNRIRPFRLNNLAGLKHVWIKYILKYPKNYIKHFFYFFKGECSLYIKPAKIETLLSKNIFLEYEINSKFDNKGITFDNFKSKLYESLFLILKPTYIKNYIIMSYLLFIISLLLFLFKPYFRNNILLFTICVSLSAINTHLFISLFSPILTYRYIHPVFPISIIALISFITFIYDRGGFKKFFKELRGEKK